MVRKGPDGARAAGVDDGGAIRPAEVIEDGPDSEKRPRQLTRQLRSNPAGVSSASEARCNTPALLTSVVNDPNRSTAALTATAH